MSLSVCAWFISPGIISPGFIHVVVNSRIFFSFLRLNTILFFIYAHTLHTLFMCNIYIFMIFIHSFLDRHLGYILAIVSNVAMNMGMQLSLSRSWFQFLWYVFRSGISRSFSSSIFNFKRNFHTVFYSGCTFYLPTSGIQGSQLLHNLANTCYLLFLFWIIAILRGVWGDVSLSFLFTFLWWLVMLNTFSCTCWPSVWLFW